MSRGRALRTGVAFDMRTGFKERGRKLVQDGERPGLWTRHPDPEHPSRFRRVPPPDGLNYRPGPPAAHAIGARVDLSWVMASDTHTVNGGFTQQPEEVLQRRARPVINIHPVPAAIVHAVEYVDGALIWNNSPLVWNGIPLSWTP